MDFSPSQKQYLLRLPARVFFFSDFLAYTLFIPATVLLSYWVLPITGVQILIFSGVISILLTIAGITNVYQIRNLFSPVIGYFNKLFDGEEISEEEYILARDRVYSTPRKRLLTAVITWIILMTTAIVIFTFTFNMGLTGKVILYSALLFNVLSIGCLYYLSLEAQIRKVARLGVFARKIKNEKIHKTKMSLNLSLTIISFMGIMCAVIIPVLFKVVQNTYVMMYEQQMKHTAASISKELAISWDAQEDKNTVWNEFKSRLSVGNTGRILVLDGGGRVLSPPDPSGSKPEFTIPAVWNQVQAGTGGVPSRFIENGRTILFYFEKNDVHGFYITAAFPLSEIESIQFIPLLVMISFVAVTLGLIGLGIFKLLESRLRPLERSRITILAMGEGSLQHEVEHHLNDDVGIILSTLNDFVVRLRDIIKNIQDVAAEMASSSNEMSATSTSFSENAQNQASAAEEATATAEQVSAGVESIAGKTDDQFKSLNVLIGQIRSLAESINMVDRNIAETVQRSGQISVKARSGEASLNQMNTSMGLITESSLQMTGIVKIITDISNQINLLSLNAAIEAARAGESGRGFAVVADEISKLADETASSIKEIDRLIKSNTDEITRGMSNITSTIELISSIIEGVTVISESLTQLSEHMKSQNRFKDSVNAEADRVRTHSEDIRQATEEQKKAMSEIVRSITHISELTQINASGAEEMSANSESVEAMAESLKRGTDFFRI